MTKKLTTNVHIGKHSYESPRVERIRLKSENSIAASQSVQSNSPSDVSVDTWTKSTDSDSNTWSG